ncbi:IS3 family transposase, partial [Bifidobacterium longum]|uniref:IS3 family transposase n=1 Tax=Bifidobacterium longum TaxID=216816 RepID=UPI00398D600B
RLLRRDGGLLDLVALPERLAAYLTHYNETRIKKSLDWMSPVQYRKHLGLAA